jgi:hypothetical protein
VPPCIPTIQSNCVITTVGSRYRSRPQPRPRVARSPQPAPTQRANALPPSSPPRHARIPPCSALRAAAPTPAFFPAQRAAPNPRPRSSAQTPSRHARIRPRHAHSRPCLLPHAAQPPPPPPSSPRSAQPPPTPRNAARSHSRSRPQAAVTRAAATRAAASILTTMRDPRSRMRMSRFVSAACKQPCLHPPPPNPRLPYNISVRSCLTPSKYTPRNLPHPIHHLRLIFSPTSLPIHDCEHLGESEEGGEEGGGTIPAKDNPPKKPCSF